ncbi:MAG TPA: MFS transporter [Solirubrobacteraceae bacterium]|nr:MFS transporter [Solirubrobacteraceae bacterium]
MSAAADASSEQLGSEQFDRDRYKWIALSNTTLSTVIATIDGTIVLIALPDIFRGIHINPLQPGNTVFLLGVVMGFLIVTAVLVVSLGRLGDIYGRVRIYNLGFVVFTIFSIPLCVTWMYGAAAGIWLIVFRVLQALGAAMLIANSAAILTDAFPSNQRGLALGINNIAGIVGSTIGLVVGGLLAPISWRLVFLVSVPVGVLGTVWSYRSLREIGEQRAASIDWWGNLAFAAGLVVLLLGIATGIQPYGHHDMGWSSPRVIAELSTGIVLLVAFGVIELNTKEPMFELRLFRIRAFLAGNVASLLGAIGRGGLQFMLVIWLQGVWLPLHGYSLATTPVWAGVAMLPLIGGFLIAGPISGILSDRFGSRRFAVAGPLLAAVSLALLSLLPVDFSYPEFAVLLTVFGIGNGMFASPNRANVMNSLPPWRRGVGSGMSATFQNSGQVLSIGIYFSLMVIGLASKLPHALFSGLVAEGVPASAAYTVAHTSPVATLFAALLGANAVTAHLSPHVLHSLSHATYTAITRRTFFPRLISPAFADATTDALRFSVLAFVVAAGASWLRGSSQRWGEETAPLASPAGDAAARGALVSR